MMWRIFSPSFVCLIALLAAVGTMVSCGSGDVTDDPCQAIDCSNHGTCAVANDKAICACDQGYHPEGLTCLADEVSDPCEQVDCSQHGTCAVEGGKPFCICEIGYHDEELDCLENDVTDSCRGVTCSGHGTCITIDDSAQCQCEDGYLPVGLACVEQADPCQEVTCSGHGVCIADDDGEAYCSCDDGYHSNGLECVENSVDDPCHGITCSDHGECSVDQNNEPLCNCYQGYHADGLNCVQDPPDPCDGVTCSDHGDCVVDGSSATCVCDSGFHPAGQTCIADQISGDQPIWFLHITDCHFGESSTAATLTSTFVDEVVSTIEPTASINTGDTADGGSNFQWLQYVNAIQNAPEYPYFFEVPGNHDKKTDDGQPFITHSQTGQAGGGFYGLTFIDSSAGTVRVVRADTSDSSSNPLNIAGIFGSDQASELSDLVSDSSGIAYSIIAAHHPLTGLEKLRLGESSLKQIVEQVGAMVYFCGHIHAAAITWLGTTLHVQGPSLGKTNPTTYSLVSIDSTGPNVRLIPLTSSPDWPVVMVTAPANASLGGTNPYSSSLPAEGLVSVRAIAFSPTGVNQVEVQIGDGTWHEMDEIGNHVYQAEVALPNSTGSTKITVRATSAEGSDAHDITVDIN